MRPNHRQLLSLLTVLVVASSCFGAETTTAPANEDSAIPLPLIPEHSFVITDYGAVADGKTLATDAIRKSVAACA
jgi:polygalacturonase